jgi:hypothetical protein
VPAGIWLASRVMAAGLGKPAGKARSGLP